MSDAALDDASMTDPLATFNLLCDRAVQMLDLLLAQVAASSSCQGGRQS
jgi:hypothetical protein